MCCNTIPRRLMLFIAFAGLLIGLGHFTITYGSDGDAQADAEATADQEADGPAVPAVLDHTVKDITGEDVYLGKYYGDVVLIVNTVSRCGLTPQYEQLQELHEQYADAGLSILGFPANNFRGQEPGTDEQIQAFCQENYGVAFDLFAKVSVKGEDQAPLYRFLTREETNPQFAGDIRWNFDKFLVSRDGRVVARFEPRARPDAEAVLEVIQAELAKPVPADAQRDDEEDPAEDGE